jgi:hypothetical protein
VSFGRVAGTAPRGAKVIVVRAGGRKLAVRHLRGRRFDLRVALPSRDTVVSVTAFDMRGRASGLAVPHVFGLPPGARPREARPHLDPALARRVVPIVRSFPGASAVYVRNLETGAGAAWNARARFPAASTLKLAIAVEALRSLSGRPTPGSYADRLLREALIYSDNGAADDLEVLFAGSTSGGGARVDALMRGLGLVDSEMYGGYERTPAVLPIPVRTDAQPSWGVGKYTSAYDLAQLFADVHLAAEAEGPLVRRFPGFTPADARYLLYLVLHSADHGKLDRFVAGTGVSVAHKAGWITGARHDAGLLYWHGGVFAVAVMTYGAGVGPASDVLAGNVTRRVLGLRSPRALDRLVFMGVVGDREASYAGFSVRPRGHGLRRLTDWYGIRHDPGPAASPNGKRIAWRINGVLVTDRNGKHARRVAKHHATDVTWSPDGRSIAFVDAEPWIRIVALDGRARQRIGTGGIAAWNVTWSPDGRFFVFLAGNGRCKRLYRMRVTGGGLRRLTTSCDGEADFSPDGLRLAFPGPGGIWVMRADGTRESRLVRTAPFFTCAWSPDGRFIAFAPATALRAPKIVLVTSSGRRVRSFRLDSPVRLGKGWRRLAYVAWLDWLPGRT